MEWVFLGSKVSRAAERRETLWLTKPQADPLNVLIFEKWGLAGSSCRHLVSQLATVSITKQLLLFSILIMIEIFLAPGISSVGTHYSHHHINLFLCLLLVQHEWRLLLLGDWMQETSAWQIKTKGFLPIYYLYWQISWNWPVWGFMSN